MPIVRVASASNDVTTLVNLERQRKGLPALRRSATLDKVAAAHATDMAKKGYFGHTAPNGTGPKHRAHRQGYRPCLIAENIAQGYRSPSAVVAGWMKSKGHRKNMLLRKVQEVGAARAPGDYWVLVLAKPGC